MMQELVFKSYHNNYNVAKYCFETNKKQININEIDIKRLVLFNKISCGKQAAIKYYIGYLHGGFIPLHIKIKEIKLYTDYMNTLANNK